MASGSGKGKKRKLEEADDAQPDSERECAVSAGKDALNALLDASLEPEVFETLFEAVSKSVRLSRRLQMTASLPADKPRWNVRCSLLWRIIPWLSRCAVAAELSDGRCYGAPISFIARKPAEAEGRRKPASSYSSIYRQPETP